MRMMLGGSRLRGLRGGTEGKWRGTELKAAQGRTRRREKRGKCMWRRVGRHMARQRHLHYGTLS